MDYRTCRSCGRIIKQGDKCECRVEAERQKHREYMREYNEENKDIVDPIKSGRYKRFRRFIINRDKGYCQRCKNLLGILTTKNLEVHHIKPRVNYPELIYEPTNVITVCKQCNMVLGISGELDFKPDIEAGEDKDYYIF